MILARVIGQAVSTVKRPQFEGTKLLQHTGPRRAEPRGQLIGG